MITRKFVLYSLTGLLVLGVALLALAHSIRPLGNPPQPYVRYKVFVADEKLTPAQGQVIAQALRGQSGIRAVAVNNNLIAVAYEPNKVGPENVQQLLAARAVFAQPQADAKGQCPIHGIWQWRFRSFFPF